VCVCVCVTVIHASQGEKHSCMHILSLWLLYKLTFSISYSPQHLSYILQLQPFLTYFSNTKYIKQNIYKRTHQTNLTSLCETGFVLGVSMGLLALFNCNIAPTIRDAAWNTVEQHSKMTGKTHPYCNWFLNHIPHNSYWICNRGSKKTTNLSTFPTLLATASMMIWSATHRLRVS